MTWFRSGGCEIRPQSGVDFGPIDYVKYAEAFGAVGLMIRTADEIAPVLKKAFDTPGPVLVGIHADYRDDHSSSKWFTRMYSLDRVQHSVRAEIRTP